jgi:hypothetical protein
MAELPTRDAEALHRALDAGGSEVQVSLSRETAELMDRGVLEFRKVGTDHRVRVSSVRALLDYERFRRRGALAELAGLRNELGLTE